MLINDYGLGTVAHKWMWAGCSNSSYLGDGEQEDHGLNPVQAKNKTDSISTKKLRVVGHIYNSSYTWDVGRRITAGLWQKHMGYTDCKK
jgi:hypothetical protein